MPNIGRNGLWRERLLTSICSDELAKNGLSFFFFIPFF